MVWRVDSATTSRLARSARPKPPNVKNLGFLHRCAKSLPLFLSIYVGSWATCDGESPHPFAKWTESGPDSFATKFAERTA